MLDDSSSSFIAGPSCYYDVKMENKNSGTGENPAIGICETRDYHRLSSAGEYLSSVSCNSETKSRIGVCLQSRTTTKWKKKMNDLVILSHSIKTILSL